MSKILDSRFYDGLGSITSIIKYTLQQPAFITMWYDRARNSDNPEEELKKIEDTLNMACERGSYVHRFLEQWCKGNLKFYHEDPKILAYVNGAINFLALFGKDLKPLERDGVKMIEKPLVCPELGFAGTPDMPCTHNGRTVMIDFKTASKPKLDAEMLHKYKLQQAALVKAYETLYPDTKFDEARLVLFTDKRKNGLGEIYTIQREELDMLWLEFKILKDRFNAELKMADQSEIVNYFESDPIMAMDRKI